MVYQMQTPLLLLAMWLLVGAAQCAEAPLPVKENTIDRTADYGQSSWEDSSSTYTVQAGYEGYLVPVETQSIKDIIRTAGIFGAIPVIGKYAVLVLLKVGVVAAVVVLLGLLVNFGLCKCTSLCPLDFHQGWDRSFTVSEDQLRSAAGVLSRAVDKFGKMERKSS